MINWIKKLIARFRNNRLDRLEFKIEYLEKQIEDINKLLNDLNIKIILLDRDKITNINDNLRSHGMSIKLLDGEIYTIKQILNKKWEVGTTVIMNPSKDKRKLPPVKAEVKCIGRKKPIGRLKTS